MSRDFLPRQDVQVADQAGRATSPYYVWFQSLERAFGALDVDLAALLEQIEQLKPGQQLTIGGAMSITVTNVDGTVTISLKGDNDSPGGNWYYGTNADGVRGFWPVADGVSGGYSITKAVDYGPYDFQGELDTPDELPYPVVVDDAYLINGDLWVGADDGGDDGAGWDNLGPAPTTAVLSLVNDEDAPDPTHYYGTDAAGDKGWHPVSDTMEAEAGELTKTVDGDGVTTFGLADVTPTTAGTLQKYGFDAKGRRDAEEAATTDDLDEGSTNLYFTDERAQDAVGAVADDSGDVELHYETSPARRLWAVLSSAVQSALSAAVSALQPGDDVSELTNDAGYTAGADWSVNLANIPANIASWAGIAPATKQDAGYLTGSSNTIRLHNSSGHSSGGALWITTSPTFSYRINGEQMFGVDSSGNMNPVPDNTRTLGTSSLRWSVVYAATGTINTSDAREKTAVGPLDKYELEAAIELAASIGAYRWISAIDTKGDGARLHIGLTVQQAISIMQSHGLDPFRYGFICYDEWSEQPEVVEDGVVTEPYRAAGDRYSFRMDELCLFIARGHDERLRRIEQALGA